MIDCLTALPADTLIAGSCYGTFVLAESGLLDGLEATTTWWLQDLFRQTYPRVRLDADRAVADGGRCLTAGAMTAHTDLTLHVLRRLFGAALARRVGGIMLVDGARSSQRPFMTLRRRFDDPLIQRASDWLAAHAGTYYYAVAGVNASGVVPVSSKSPDEQAALKAGDANVVSNPPVADTPENRAKYGKPDSNAGKRTAPKGN